MNPHPLTLADLTQIFLCHLDKETRSGNCAKRTNDYYRAELGKFLAAAGATRLVSELKRLDLERHKTNWHSVQAVQRLFNWGESMEILDHNPFRNVQRPPSRPRERVLTDWELAHLLRAASAPFRRFLVGMRETLARPQEVRAFRWNMLNEELGAFVLKDFKGKKRRRDGKARRLILVSPRLNRLLNRLRLCRAAASQLAQGYVFLNNLGAPWSANAVRCSMRRLREKLGWADDDEHVVAYTLRHTAATGATAHGVSDRRLAELMGHSSTRTTARYQHLQADHLRDALDQAQGRRRA